MEEESWDYIWTELVVEKKGARTFLDREGIDERDCNFSEEMLEEMLHELNRMIRKYSSTEWYWRQTANDLVNLFIDHRSSLEQAKS